MQEYLGTAIKYPIEVNQYGRAVLVEGKDIIPQSIEAILLTPKGSRFFLPEFGSDIQHVLYEQNDEVLKNLLYYIITDALSTWEKRISVDDIEFNFVSTDKPKIECIIHYTILKSNEVDSFIFPFYREIIY